MWFKIDGLTGSFERTSGNDKSLEKDPSLELKLLAKSISDVGRLDPKWYGDESLLEDIFDFEVAHHTSLTETQKTKLKL